MKINKQFKDMRESSGPSSEFSERLWERLDAQLPAGIIHKSKKRRRMQIGAGIASLLMLLSGGTGTFAYGAETVTPEHPLYGVRAGIEKVEERLKTNPEARAAFHEKMAQRRAMEFDRTDRPDHKELLRQRMIEHLDLSEEEIEGLKDNPEARAAIKERLDALRDTHMEEMRVNALERLDTALENGEIDAEKAAEIRERLENGEVPHRSPHRHVEGNGPHDHPMSEDQERPLRQ